MLYICVSNCQALYPTKHHAGLSFHKKTAAKTSQTAMCNRKRSGCSSQQDTVQSCLCYFALQFVQEIIWLCLAGFADYCVIELRLDAGDCTSFCLRIMQLRHCSQSLAEFHTHELLLTNCCKRLFDMRGGVHRCLPINSTQVHVTLCLCKGLDGCCKCISNVSVACRGVSCLEKPIEQALLESSRIMNCLPDKQGHQASYFPFITVSDSEFWGCASACNKSF